LFLWLEFLAKNPRKVLKKEFFNFFNEFFVGRSQGPCLKVLVNLGLGVNWARIDTFINLMNTYSARSFLKKAPKVWIGAPIPRQIRNMKIDNRALKTF